MRAAMIDMESWLHGVESSTLLLARVLQQRDYSHAGLNRCCATWWRSTATFSARPSHWRPRRRTSHAGFAPYYFRRGGKLEYVDLADPQYNYRHQAWFTDTLAAGKPLWVEPYFDAGGGEALMTTFAVPVYREDSAGQRVLYAVVTADVSLAELHAYLQRLRLGSSGFGFLLSREGIILSGRQSGQCHAPFHGRSGGGDEPGRLAANVRRRAAGTGHQSAAGLQPMSRGAASCAWAPWRPPAGPWVCCTRKTK